MILTNSASANGKTADAVWNGTITIDTLPDIALQINALHAEATRAHESMAEYAMQCGELLIKAKAQAGHGNWGCWLAENCPEISQDTAGVYMRLYRNRDKLNSERARNMSIRDAVATIAGERPRVASNTGCFEWYTPPEIIEAARSVMRIDLDPASCEFANETVKATTYYSIENDGLSKEWRGNVFLNPPYKNSLIVQFTDKLLLHVEAGHVPQAVVLTNNATDSGWFQKMARASTAICFTAGRVKFIDPTGKQSNNATQGQAVLYFGERRDRFREVFGEFGFVVDGRAGG
jgi:hypothetical protein